MDTKPLNYCYINGSGVFPFFSCPEPELDNIEWLKRLNGQKSKQSGMEILSFLFRVHFIIHSFESLTGPFFVLMSPCVSLIQYTFTYTTRDSDNS